MPYRAVAAAALAAWRDAEQRMAALDPASEEWREHYLAGELAKVRYHDAFDAAKREHLPEPPPFAEASLSFDVVQVRRDLK